MSTRPNPRFVLPDGQANGVIRGTEIGVRHAEKVVEQGVYRQGRSVDLEFLFEEGFAKLFTECRLHFFDVGFGHDGKIVRVVFHALFDGLWAGREQDQNHVRGHVAFPRLGGFHRVREVRIVVALPIDHFFDVKAGEQDVLVFVDQADVIGDLKTLKTLFDGRGQFGHGLLIRGIFQGLLVRNGKVIVHVMANPAIHAPLLDGLNQRGFARVFRADNDDAHGKLLVEKWMWIRYIGVWQT